MATEKTWFDFVDESTTGDYVKFEDGDEKVLKIVTNPVGGKIEFKQEDGSIKVNDGLKMSVLVDNSPEIKEWTVTSKQLMQQLKAISVREGIGPNIAGSIFRVNVSGMGMKRKYFMKLLQKPGQVAQPAPQPRPEPIPVTDADRERDFQARQAQVQAVPQSQDPGVAWIEGQKSGLDQVPTSVQAAQGAR